MLTVYHGIEGRTAVIFNYASPQVSGITYRGSGEQ
jgi:hypothetical protein